MRPPFKHLAHPGFTFVELIASLVVMGILAVSVTLTNMDGQADVDGQAETLKARIRYAQAKAMGRNIPYGVVVVAGGYHLFAGSSVANKERFPGEENLDVPLPSGITTTPGTISFDDRGRPFSNAAQTAALAANLVITLTDSSATRTITVTPGTGYVP